MPVLERSIALRGPKFYRDGKEELFVNHIDGSTRDGPRPATDEDRAAHTKAYATYLGDGDKAAEAFAPPVAMVVTTPADGPPPKPAARPVVGPR